MSQQMLADVIGKSLNTVGLYERGLRQPSLRNAVSAGGYAGGFPTIITTRARKDMKKDRQNTRLTYRKLRKIARVSKTLMRGGGSAEVKAGSARPFSDFSANQTEF